MTDTPAQDSPIGEVIRGDHHVLAAYRGFLGVVYICRQDLPRGRHVFKAIKTFRKGKATQRLFDGELAYWVALPPHPNVVQARDADTVHQLLVLEFVPGPNLREVAQRGPIHPQHFLNWALEIAAGLGFLHEQEFLHRDLRPENVLIDPSCNLRAKISDLGIGKPFDPEAASHTVIGTYNFMAPEVHRGETDFRSDIFSYGATLYYLLTGRYAVKLSTKDLDRVVPPQAIITEIPLGVQEIVLQCLDCDPDSRPQTMAEVSAALDAIDSWDPVQFRYDTCAVHGYAYLKDARQARCPFCDYVEDFERRQQKLATYLRRKARRREQRRQEGS